MKASPFLHNKNSVEKIMQTTIVALLPAVACLTFIFGFSPLINLILSICCALSFEVCVLYLRRLPIQLFLKDYSAVLTAILIALSLPFNAPFYAILFANFFAIVIAKHLYGGIGQNPFNPAMVGFVATIISFPSLFAFQLLPFNYDAISGATILDVIKHKNSLTIDEILQTSEVLGVIGSKGYEILSFCYLIGGMFLIKRRIITYYSPLAMIFSVFIFSSILYLFDSSSNLNPFATLFSGNIALGAFFIVTDPVSSASSTNGKIIFAAGVGLITMIIRYFGNFADGVAFAVLLMNAIVPIIDKFTIPKPYGYK